jgi:hypothetical protein
MKVFSGGLQAAPLQNVFLNVHQSTLKQLWSAALVFPIGKPIPNLNTPQQ